jgi:hypothetical protein
MSPTLKLTRIIWGVILQPGHKACSHRSLSILHSYLATAKMYKELCSCFFRSWNKSVAVKI